MRPILVAGKSGQLARSWSHWGYSERYLLLRLAAPNSTSRMPFDRPSCEDRTASGHHQCCGIHCR